MSLESRWIDVKYRCLCQRCQKEILPGTRAFWVPMWSVVYCSDDLCGLVEAVRYKSSPVGQRVAG